MRYRLRHVTRYRYDEPVDLAAHLLHLTPRTLPQQTVLAASLTALPEPARAVTRADHFGNTAGWLFLDAPHDRFAVTLQAEVAVAFPPPPPAAQTLPWEQVAAAGDDRARRRSSPSPARWCRPSRRRAATRRRVFRPGGRCWRGCSISRRASAATSRSGRGRPRSRRRWRACWRSAPASARTSRI